MTDTQSETRLDRWSRKAKDNPVLSVVLLIAAVIGGLASFSDSVRSLLTFWHPVQTTVPVVQSFQADPQQINAGDSAIIQWKVRSADSVVIDGGIGQVPISGNQSISPLTTTTYTLTASNQDRTIAAATTVKVVPGSDFDGDLLLEDVFQGDGGWAQPQDSAFRGSIGGGRFRMEWVSNRSAQCVTRDVAIGASQDFSIQVSAQMEQPSGYSLGLCWRAQGGQATYMLYVFPGTPASPSLYDLVRDETWQQVAADGQAHPYGGSVNLLDPGNVNHQFPSSAIQSGTAANVLKVVRRGDKLRVFINGQYVNQVSYPQTAISQVGIFISGQLAADFSDFSVRAAK